MSSTRRPRALACARVTSYMWFPAIGSAPAGNDPPAPTVVYRGAVWHCTAGRTQTRASHSEASTVQAPDWKLEGKAKEDKALARGLAKMKKEAQRIANAKMDVADYLLALYLLDDLKGQLYGYDYYVDPAWRSDWIVVDTYVDYYTPIYADVWTDYTYDWDYVTTPVDIYVDDNVYVDEPLSAAEIDAQENFVEDQSFDMTDAEENQVAEDNDNDVPAD